MSANYVVLFYPGMPGISGMKGDRGYKGTSGPKGESGPSGEKGPMGDMGTQGKSGIPVSENNKRIIHCIETNRSQPHIVLFWWLRYMRL